MDIMDMLASTGGLDSMAKELGISRERRIAMIMLDTVDFPVVFWGAIKAGIVPVAMNTLLICGASGVPTARRVMGSVSAKIATPSAPSSRPRAASTGWCAIFRRFPPPGSVGRMIARGRWGCLGERVKG